MGHRNSQNLKWGASETGRNGDDTDGHGRLLQGQDRSDDRPVAAAGGAGPAHAVGGAGEDVGAGLCAPRSSGSGHAAARAVRAYFRDSNGSRLTVQLVPGPAFCMDVWPCCQPVEKGRFPFS